MSDSFDPYLHVDNETLRIWSQFEESIGVIPRVIIEPDLYLKYVVTPPDYDGHTQQTLDQGIAQVVDIYKSTFEEVFQHHSDNLLVTQTAYAPPAAFGKGGPIGAAYQVLQFAIDNPETMEIGRGVVGGLLAEAVWKSSNALFKYFRSVKIPESEQRPPSHDPILITAVCETHSREFYSEFRPKPAQVFSALNPPSSNLPVDGNVYTIVVPYRNGSIIYVVTERMELLSHFRVHSKGAVPLDRSTWYGKFIPDQ